jgi:hypothetical protein
MAKAFARYRLLLPGFGFWLWFEFGIICSRSWTLDGAAPALWMG